MIFSMTGYGKANVSHDIADIIVEVKTLNSKFLDANVRLPRELSSYELEVRRMLSDTLKRGKVNLTVEVLDKKASTNAYQIDAELLKSYYQEYRKVAEELDDIPTDLFRLAAQSPDVVQSTNSEEVNSELWAQVRENIQQALERCTTFREQEGDALEKDITERVQQITTTLELIETEVPERNTHLRERLKTQLQEFSQENLDQNRFEQEVIYYLEKLDINEEIVRLKNHLIFFSKVLSEPQASGKKLGFVSQEIGREINTIGAKANNAAIQHHVVAMKEELEKIKEQVLNVL